MAGREDFLVMCFSVVSTRANISFVDVKNEKTTALLMSENLEIKVSMP